MDGLLGSQTVSKQLVSESEAHSGEGLPCGCWDEHLCFRRANSKATCKEAGGRERLAAGRPVRKQWKPNEQVLNWSSDSRNGVGREESDPL